MRQYLDQSVYDAAIERLDFIFAHFTRVYVSFSGGKDSGVLLNLVCDYIRDRQLPVKIGVQIMDNEANYNHREEFMHRIL